MASTERPAAPQGVHVYVDWAELEMAFANNRMGVHSYFHVPSGRVLRLTDAPGSPAVPPQLHADSAYLRIAPVLPGEQHRWMESFIDLLGENALAHELLAAIRGRGAFRRFREVLSGRSEYGAWVEFREGKLRAAAASWLAGHGRVAVARSPAVAPAVRHHGFHEAKRDKLLRLAEALDLRDLDSLVKVGAFLGAPLRGTVRGPAHRGSEAG